MGIRTPAITFLAISGVIVLLTACAPTSSLAAGDPAKRTIYMAAIEPKGSTTTAKEPFPTSQLPSGGGYILKAPNKEGTWEVSTYRYFPSTVVINQGDEVTLEIVGINGKEHATAIEGYNVQFSVLRGQVSRATFKADKAGIFNIVCTTHRPSMTAQLTVLPRP
ncbi:MAG: hypothetical protein HY684_05285 [Chloroflexi bacterium]|nr:hypothetical protein [Chloroflexota bacterium]